MGWWTSMVNGTKSLGNGASWVWHKTPITPVVSYATDTMFYVVEQGLALREAIPAIFTPAVLKVIEGMGNILFYDVLPVVVINYANNQIQNYGRAEYEEDQTAMLPSYAILSTLALIDYGVKAYTYRQGAKLLIHTLVLDSLSPAAFNEYKTKLPAAPTLCIEEDCNYKRKFKGSLREPLILASNDLILWGISNFPYGGKQISRILAIYFYGEYITRMATPERCERHKAMKSESVLSLGLTYHLSSALMDHFLESTVGMPPYLYLRTLRHLLLLLHINLASHMDLPLVKPQKDVIPIDPLVLYNRASRFVVDVIFSGLMKRIPIDFRPPPGSKPFIPLSTVLKFLTRILDSDLEKVTISQPGFFKKNTKLLLPSMFHSSKNAVNDPVIKLFWPKIQAGTLYTIEIVEAAGKPVATLTTGPKPLASAVKHTLPTVLNIRFGLPIKLSEFLLSLSKKEDFWAFINALKLWIERNNVSYEIKLTSGSIKAALHETGKIIEFPSNFPVKTLPAAENLQTPKTSTAIDAQLLIPQRPTSIAAHSLFSTRQRRPAQPAVEELGASLAR